MWMEVSRVRADVDGSWCNWVVVGRSRSQQSFWNKRSQAKERSLVGWMQVVVSVFWGMWMEVSKFGWMWFEVSRVG